MHVNRNISTAENMIHEVMTIYDTITVNTITFNDTVRSRAYISKLSLIPYVESNVLMVSHANAISVKS